MLQLIEAIPDPKILLDLAPEELGAKMLFLLRKRGESSFHPDNLYSELWSGDRSGGRPSYPRGHEKEVELAIAEAWAWLTAQGLIIPVPGINGQNGWRCLRRRARNIETNADFNSFKMARLLPREILHSKIADNVWRSFMRGDLDPAVFQAMRAVEIEVRAAVPSIPNNLLGVKLMRAAFASPSGPLTDTSADPGEQVARMELFAGAIGSCKNPSSHRQVQFSDPAEAIEMIILASHLLRIVEQRVAAGATQ